MPEYLTGHIAYISRTPFSIAMKIQTLARALLDLVEVHLPAVAFITMFGVFVTEIIARYFFNNPFVWTYEISTMAYTWTILLGACLASRQRSHIAFDLMVERLSGRSKLVVEILGNLLVIGLFIAALYPSWDFIRFSKVTKTPVLLIPMSIGFFPFLIFLVLTISHLSYDTFLALRKLLRWSTSKRQFT